MSGASSMRNAVKRITHKERSQPAARKKLGLLEKHKDYVVRAQDYHKKKKYINNLKKKAAERNTDEFYYKMNNSKVEKGAHIETFTSTIDPQTLKLMKTQDLGYIVHKKSVDMRKAEKLKENLHMIGEKKVKEHKIFVDDEAELENFDLAEHLDTIPELVDREYNRPRKSQLEQGVLTQHKSVREVKKAMETAVRSYTELNNRIKRSNKLETAINAIQLERKLAGKGSKRKVGEGGKDGIPIYKWKRQRAR